jgi:uncharacterized protein YlbG (UPF0298 family)
MSLAIGSARYVRVCRRSIKPLLSDTQYIRAAHSEKTHPTPAGVNQIFEFRISMFIVTSVPRLYRAWVYFFSTRRKLVILYPNKLEINRCINSLEILSPRHIHVCRRCIKPLLSDTQYVRAAHTEKTHPTPAGVNQIFEFRISMFIVTSVPRLYRAWVYFFSTRRKLVILYPNKLEIITQVNVIGNPEPALYTCMPTMH